jgi:uncharacterized protein YybS (DUF2232 family)
VTKAVQRDVHKDIISGAGITSLLFISSLYLPIIGSVCTLLIPLPILFYRSKLGRRTGAIIPGITLIIMVVLQGGISIDILFFAELLLLGFVLSELIEINLSIEKTLLYAVGIILSTGLIALLFYSAVIQKGILTLISEYVAKNLELTLSIYESIGVSEQNLELISKSLDQIHYVMVRTIPALIFSGTLFVAWASLLFARPMITRRTLFFPDFGSLVLWKAPDHLVWGVIGCGALLLLPDGLLYILGLNGLIILMMVYFFEGIAIVAFYFNKLGLPRLIRITLYGLVAIQQFLLLVVVGLGFFDIWLNFRRLEKEKQG